MELEGSLLSPQESSITVVSDEMLKSLQ